MGTLQLSHDLIWHNPVWGRHHTAMQPRVVTAMGWLHPIDFMVFPTIMVLCWCVAESFAKRCAVRGSPRKAVQRCAWWQ